ncbi:MAG TPA: methyl-accepting chemotaxis protein [Solimonas sp.]|nr:methyl-accepting chemotaxis protein [Solimonas sp.]
MKNLKVWQKLALMGIAFGIPFAVVTWSMVKSINEMGTDFTRQERRGIEYQIPLLALLKDLQQDRGLSAVAAGGDASFKERITAKAAELQRDIAAVDEVSGRLDRFLHVGEQWSTLRAGINAVLAEAPSLSAADSFQRHNALVTEALALIGAIADVSNLTLDQGIDSYYLMAASLDEGTQLTEALALVRGIGSRLAAQGGTVAPETRERLIELSGRADYLGQRFSDSVAKAYAANEGLQADLQTYMQASTSAVRDTMGLIKTLGNDREPIGAGDYFDTATTGIDKIFEAEQQLLTALGKLLDVRIAKFEREVNITLLLAALGLFAATAIGIFITRDITRPLHEVVGIANQIAKGDLNVATTLERRRDEIGELAAAFDRMVSALREMVHVAEELAEGNLSVQVTRNSDVDQIGNALGTMVTSLAGIVSQVQKSGIQVASSVNEIAATAKQQQATAQEIAATTMEIGATSKEISVTARELVKAVGEVSVVADQSATLATNGQAGLTRMEETMRHVVEAAGTINAKLAILNDKAGNISQVVTTITKVSDQTNLLSLNAAIEAEKAGEYGRGFSVVATEIRRLADQTAVATYDIEQMVKEIQSAVSAGVMGMDKFSEEVRRGMNEVQQVGGQLSQIITQVQALAPRFESVNEGMQAQSTGAEQITQALAQLNEAAQQTVESLRQSSQAIDGLNDVSGNLRSSVSRFKLEST